MKALFIRFFILPQGSTLVTTICVAILILLHSPLLTASSNGNRDEFPKQRQGGGTHLYWRIDPDHVV